VYLVAFVAATGDPAVRLVVIIVEELPIPTPLVEFSGRALYRVAKLVYNRLSGHAHMRVRLPEMRKSSTPISFVLCGGSVLPANSQIEV